MEEDKERDLEILKNYQKKEAQGIKKIFIIIFILVALGYLANLLMQIKLLNRLFGLSIHIILSIANNN